MDSRLVLTSVLLCLRLIYYFAMRLLSQFSEVYVLLLPGECGGLQYYQMHKHAYCLSMHATPLSSDEMDIGCD